MPDESPSSWNTLDAAAQARLLRAPLWAFLTVAAADGAIDEEEINAFLKIVQEQESLGSPLLAEVLVALTPQAKQLFGETVRARKETTPGQAMTAIADVLEAKLDAATAKEFKVALLRIGLRVAEASSDGGESKVAEREKLTLEKMAQALRVELA